MASNLARDVGSRALLSILENASVLVVVFSSIYSWRFERIGCAKYELISEARSTSIVEVDAAVTISSRQFEN
jgi:hypothetical protein